VREATQQAFEQLVLKVRRSLAPFLKSLMGHWLMAQCDTYVPAASAACLAFTAAFPQGKQAEALSFCREEILNVSDIAVTPTPINHTYLRALACYYLYSPRCPKVSLFVVVVVVVVAVVVS